MIAHDRADLRLHFGKAHPGTSLRDYFSTYVEDSGDVVVDYEMISQPGLNLTGSRLSSKVSREVEIEVIDIEKEQEGVPKALPDQDPQPGPDTDVIEVPCPGPKSLPDTDSEISSTPDLEILSDPDVEILSDPDSEILSEPDSEILSETEPKPVTESYQEPEPVSDQDSVLSSNATSSDNTTTKYTHTYTRHTGWVKNSTNFWSPCTSSKRWYDGSKYKCNFCPRVYESPNLVIGHLRDIHKDKDVSARDGYIALQESDYVCKLCSRRIKHNKITIKLHLKNSHSLSLEEYEAHVRNIDIIYSLNPENVKMSMNEHELQDHIGKAHAVYAHEEVSESGMITKAKSCEQETVDIWKQEEGKSRNSFSIQQTQVIKKFERLKAKMQRVQRKAQLSIQETAATNRARYQNRKKALGRKYRIFALRENSHLIKPSSDHNCKKFACNVCSKSFNREAILKRHLRFHDWKNDSEIQLKVANVFSLSKTRFSKMDDNSMKMDNQIERSDYKCDLCSYDFTSQSNLEQHIRNVHLNIKIPEGEKSFACKFCLKSFSRKNHLKDHYRTHTGEKPYNCTVCSKSFAHISNRDQHFRIHTGEKPFECKLCSMSFGRMNTLKNHVRIHTGEKPYDCPVCSKSFARREPLNKHITRNHADEKPFNCNFCSMAFKQNDTLKEHVRIHTGEKSYDCTICLKSFAQSSLLNRHLRIHTGEKPFICNFCSMAFKQNAHLKHHVRIHTGEKPYDCAICLKSFAHSSNRDQHLRIHTGGKQFNCKFCQMSFNRSTELRIHTRTHTGEKPYDCTICLKSFAQSSHLNQHHRIHTGEKPFICNMCPKAFRRNGARNHHISNVHLKHKNVTAEEAEIRFLT